VGVREPGIAYEPPAAALETAPAGAVPTQKMAVLQEKQNPDSYRAFNVSNS